ncbi:MAG: D-alanine--D-alanine ligase [Chloroflexi bacterium]|nr:D-alanine--D-alanine ligase [Chloroflexota bacterium]
MAENAKIRIGLICGGRSGEHEISLLSARSVRGALDAEKYAITMIGVTHEGAWLAGEGVLEALESGDASVDTPGLSAAVLTPDTTRKGLYVLDGESQILRRLVELDVVFPVLHGTFGEDGTIQGLLEMAEVAYVGSGVLGSSLGMDKAVFKDVMRANGIPVVESITVLRKEIEGDMDGVLKRAEALAAYPLFVKPANLGSSVGISKCRSRSDLLEGLMEAARYDRRVLVERGVNGREIEVSVLGNDEPQASVPGEIIPADEFYTYDAKYFDDRSQLLIPAPVSARQAETVQDLARRAFLAADCAGLARADFLLDKDSGEIFLNEINTIPGFTRISMYPKLWGASGLPYPALVDRLVELALERRRERDRTERRFTRP